MKLGETNRRPADWIRLFHPAPEPFSRLACFPHAGGTANHYHGVSAALSPEVEALAIQYPGRQDRWAAPHPGSIQGLAQQAVSALAPWTDRPLALFGHSMGALVAFEAARLLADEGTVPHRLIVSGCRAPSRPREGSVHRLDDAGIIAHLKELGGTASEVLDNEELRAMFLPAMRADYRAVESYRYVPGPPLSCPVLILTGDSDPATTLDEANAWGEHTSAGSELRVYSGGHFFLDEHAAGVTELIRTRCTPTG
ncbi:thioesterase II family protein [Streptomyces sp. NBC_00576]|uniref:thioesterase II family protein n=1 Tax=Streptomyces sp. NBC_00576 TaxID=2903665 RepID=UPI003FCE108A|nr:alpha/beta fold hydrolase [Streptomyces sp. NBC_00576]